MNSETQLVIALALILVTGLLTVVSRFSSTDHVLRFGHVTVVPLAVWYFFLIPAREVVIWSFHTKREDPWALFESGLSLSNQATAAIGVLTFAIGVMALGLGKLRISQLIAGPRKWMTLLICLFALTNLWSAWPVLSIYRTVELMGYWLVTVYVFDRLEWKQALATYCVIVLIAVTVPQLPEMFEKFSQGQFFSAIRANTYNPVAAVLILILIHHRSMARDVHPLLWAGAGFAFVALGSIGTTVGLILALLVMSFIGSRKLYVRVSFGLFALLLFLIIFAAVVDQGFYQAMVQLVATIFQRDPESLLSATGRLPLWQIIYENTKSNHLGLGFGAAERIVLLRMVEAGQLWWGATSAHNAYIAVWLGGGWPAIWCLLILLVSAISSAIRMRSAERPLVLAILILTVINSLSHSGIGGIYSAIFGLFMMSLAHPGMIAPRHSGKTE